MCAGSIFGIQFNVILPAAPGVTRIVQQIVYLVSSVAICPNSSIGTWTNAFCLPNGSRFTTTRMMCPCGGHLAVKNKIASLSAG